MLVYNRNKKQFLNDVSENHIEDIILNCLKRSLKINVGKNQITAFKNSLTEMYVVLNDDHIPDDAGIAIEYNIPGSSKRIDFIITGSDQDKDDCVILIELKQRSESELTDKDGIVITRFDHGKTETSHPSYQAWSYASLLRGFNKTVYEEGVQLYPCAYLHNYNDDGVITNDFYKEYIQRSPLFLRDDKQRLRDFIKQYIRHGDNKELMVRIDKGEIRPSKALADSLASMIKGNQEFIMIDEQKLVYETAINLAKKSTDLNKNVLIVEGGPGTGKSVIAINLLVNLNNLDFFSQYVTKNAAPREVYESKLTGTIKKTEISNLFVGSGSFTSSKTNQFHTLIVDEAHRLNEKSGLFSNMGENQIKEIINASKLSIFFIDEDQKVTLKDIGEKEEIIKRAKYFGAKITQLGLSSQFRCNGSDGYLSWLDSTLQIKETANITLDTKEYDFRIIDNPNTLRDLIFEKNGINNKARLVAGYCWNWNKTPGADDYDIEIEQYNFKMRWNLTQDGNLWILNPRSVKEVGCIHTCQGLDLDYIGVIVGDDLVVRNGKVITNPEKRAKTDNSLKGYKKLLAEDKEKAEELVDRIIKNTYRTLMTRGMKGCYVYFVDKETEEYFRGLME